MQVFHVAEAARWEAARLSGSYARSTRGRTLEQEGFIHACRAEQLDEVRRRYYADVADPLVVLVIDTDRLTSPWSEDEVGDTTYPHIHGPLNPDAVVSVLPLGDPASAPDPAPRAAPPSEGTLISAFLGEMMFRMLMAALVMALVLVGATVADGLGTEPLVGVVAGLAVGVPVWALAARRRNRRRDTP